MPTKVLKNGRITVPKQIRDYLGLEPDTEVAFRQVADGSIVIERANGIRSPGRLAQLMGCAGPCPTTDELMALLRGDD